MARVIFLLIFLAGSFMPVRSQDSSPAAAKAGKDGRGKGFSLKNLAGRHSAASKGIKYIEKHEFGKAIGHLTREISKLDTAKNLYLLHSAGYLYDLRGLAYYYLQNFDSAYFNARTSLRIVPKWPDAWYIMGLVQFARQEYDSSLYALNGAIKLNESNRNYYLARGGTYLQLKRYGEAIDDYTACIGLDDKWYFPYLFRADAKLRQKDYRGAISDRVKARELNPGFLSCQPDLCNMYAMAGDYLQAAGCYKTYLEKVPGHPGALDGLGYACMATGDHGAAKTAFEKCVDLHPDYADAFLGLALLSWYTGDQAGAGDFLDRAVKLKPVLKEGLAGFEKYREEGWYFNSKDEETLRKLFGGQQ